MGPGQLPKDHAPREKDWRALERGLLIIFSQAPRSLPSILARLLKRSDASVSPEVCQILLRSHTRRPLGPTGVPWSSSQMACSWQPSAAVIKPGAKFITMRCSSAWSGSKFRIMSWNQGEHPSFRVFRAVNSSRVSHMYSSSLVWISRCCRHGIGGMMVWKPTIDAICT